MNSLYLDAFRMAVWVNYPVFRWVGRPKFNGVKVFVLDECRNLSADGEGPLAVRGLKSLWGYASPVRFYHLFRLNLALFRNLNGNGANGTSKLGSKGVEHGASVPVAGDKLNSKEAA